MAGDPCEHFPETQADRMATSVTIHEIRASSHADKAVDQQLELVPQKQPLVQAQA